MEDGVEESSILEQKIPLSREDLLEFPQRFFERITRPEGALILIDKPYGETSFYAVNQLRKLLSRITGIRRIKCGHAGTLDPLATGLLIIATRKATKLLQGLQGLEKTYLVRMRFGVTSPSLDLERPIEICNGAEKLNEENVRTAILSLPGEHNQMPPVYSAIKQQGQPVYKKARAGADIILTPRVIQVHDVSIVSIDLPEVMFRVRVSKGTYIRSLVRDIAFSLGTCGILVDLVRERVAEWSAENALALPEVVEFLINCSRDLQITVTEPNMP